MGTQELPVCRSAHLKPYVDVLYKIGIPVERRLREVGLPTMLADDPDLYLPTVPMLDFVDRVCRKDGIDDLGFRATKSVKVDDLAPRLKLKAHHTPTLRLALEAFSRNARFEASLVSFWLVTEGPNVRICSFEDLHYNEAGSHCSDWTQNMILVSIVRAFAGPRWCPPEMAFRTDVPLSPAARDAFPNTRFLTRQKAAWIVVPRAMLALTPLSAGEQDRGIDSCANQHDEEPPNGDDLTCSLQKVLKAYLCDGYPQISLASRIVGKSVRTLQRNLARADTTYSDVVEAARFELATEMLADPDNKIIDIALAVGYDDPSHFSRAFRRITALTPREFRAGQAAMLQVA